MPISDDIEIQNSSDDDVVPYEYSITSYGADYPVDGLVKRINAGSIFIPHFQREFVWSQNDSSKFVESLLLGLPVPGIFLSRESETQKLLVIDGQQRLRSLQYFYSGVFSPIKREFSLTGIKSKYEGKSYNTLSTEDRLRLDDSILHATIIKQDEPSKDNSSVYHIFERLNTGGKLLKPQEIRACIYYGEFSKLLNSLNEDRYWRDIFGNVNKFLRDQELILRFLALFYEAENYKRPMKLFLNKFMGKHRNLEYITAESMKQTFSNTIAVVHNDLVDLKPFRPERALNAAIFDAVMVGIAKRLQKGDITDREELRRAYKVLMQNEKFIEATRRATANEENVEERIRIANDEFAKVA